MARRPSPPARISVPIPMPSPTLMNFLRSIVFDDAKYVAFMENATGSLRAHGIQLDRQVSTDHLARFGFAVDCARQVVKQKRVSPAKFASVFNLPDMRLVDGELRLVAGTISSEKIACSTKSAMSNRGAKTEFRNADSLSTTRSDHWRDTSFKCYSALNEERPDELFQRAPLLDAATLVHLAGALSAVSV